MKEVYLQQFSQLPDALQEVQRSAITIAIIDRDIIPTGCPDCRHKGICVITTGQDIAETLKTHFGQPQRNAEVMCFDFQGTTYEVETICQKHFTVNRMPTKTAS